MNSDEFKCQGCGGVYHIDIEGVVVGYCRMCAESAEAEYEDEQE